MAKSVDRRRRLGPTFKAERSKPDKRKPGSESVSAKTHPLQKIIAMTATSAQRLAETRRHVYSDTSIRFLRPLFARVALLRA